MLVGWALGKRVDLLRLVPMGSLVLELLPFDLAGESAGVVSVDLAAGWSAA